MAQSTLERCAAFTVAGRRCRNEGKRRENGEVVCKQHHELAARKKAPPVVVNELDRAKDAIRASARSRWLLRRFHVA